MALLHTGFGTQIFWYKCSVLHNAGRQLNAVVFAQSWSLGCARTHRAASSSVGQETAQWGSLALPCTASSVKCTVFPADVGKEIWMQLLASSLF